MGDNFEVKSKGKTGKSKRAEQELEKLRKEAAADKEKAKKAGAEKEKKEKEARKKAEDARKKAGKAQEKKFKKKEKEMGDIAAAAGGAVIAKLTSSSVSRKKKVAIFAAVVVGAVVIAIAFLFFKPQLSAMLGFSISQGTESGILPDDVMGYSKIDFTNAVLGKAREEAKLIVLEQDVEVESEISNALANLAVFKKAKTIHSEGTGYYTVDLDGFSEDNVSVDMEKKKVTVTIPKAVLDHSAVDPDKTTFEKTDHAILGFGDVKLTQEQQNELDRSIKKAMSEVLDTDKQLKKADELACLKVRSLLQPVVSAVSNDFVVEVVQ